MNMNGRYLPWYALALAVLIVGLAVAGVPMSALLVALVVLACPLMMLLMMGGHGHGGNDDVPHDMSRPHDHGPTSGRS